MSNLKESFKTQPVVLFEKGVNNCRNYRIPSLLATGKGTLIAAIDARVDEPGDNPNNIDKAVRRSLDNGVTWEDVKVLVDYPGKGRKEGAAAIDPAMLEDRETGTIWMIFSQTPGGIGLWSSRPGTGFDSNGYRLLYDRENNGYTLREDGRVVAFTGEKTDRTVRGNGDVYRIEDKIGNIYLDRGPLLQARTSFLQAVYSSDDGLTWSEPMDLNPQVKAPWMSFIGAGPGAGIQISSGEHKGRLVFPVYYSNYTNSSYPRMSCCLIYSDDHGSTWHRGESPNDGRQWKGEILSSKTLDEREAELTEAQVVELDNGDLKIYMRNHSSNRRVACSVSKDGGQTWGEVIFDEVLVNPVCQFSVIKYPGLGGGKSRIIFSGPMDENERVNGKMLVSEDSGDTWRYSNTITGGSFIYSCLAVLPDNRIGILYETEDEEKDIKIIFESFDIEEMR